jgi:hypothetical protein
MLLNLLPKLLKRTLWMMILGQIKTQIGTILCLKRTKCIQGKNPNLPSSNETTDTPDTITTLGVRF